MSVASITYNCPTYVAIRSAKDSGSSACHHLTDRKRIRTLKEFNSHLNNSKGLNKTVMIVTVNSGPDEHPRYSKTVACAIGYFVSEELYIFLLATNAPERSAFNRCERGISPLSMNRVMSFYITNILETTWISKVTMSTLT